MKNVIPTYEDLLKENEKLRNKLSTLKLTGNNQFLEDLINNINDPVFVKDASSRLVLANDAFCEIFNLPRDLILGKTLAESVPPTEREQFLKIDQAVISTGIVSLVEELLTISERKTKTIITRKSRYTDNNGTHFLIGVIHDITALKQVEEELILAREKAEESDRLKSAFLANMSHEIRTPMNAVLGFAQLLKKGNITEEKKKKYLDYIDTGGQRLLNIISDIVDISKLEAQQLPLYYEDTNLNTLIDNLKDQFVIHPINTGTEIRTIKGLDDAESIVFVDGTRLAQILSNLLENAIKFTKKGVVEFGYTIDDEKLAFFVKDNGIGIASSDQKNIFDRFIRVDNQQNKSEQGNGLGLAIAKSLVHLLEGEIRVESEVGKGTTFYFNIPYSISKKTVDVKKEANLNLKENNDITILIAEDEFLNFKYLKSILTRLKYNILHAKNGKVAVELLEENERIDLVLMDINMPIMTGFEAIAKIRKFNTTVPIIALTAYAMAEDRKRVVESGFNDYLSKPLSEHELFKKIEKHVGH
ncbi:PAS domain-containing hybrid sensor histidine kinase/response regulator [Crocinitomix catalasitica]|uniref:PAS domain-containing hybrid sensor histidine kinase/response regulator n=1 Tax=Crocinitomix catalasitica TaxID=184607 RepID=UPI000685FD90|nr:PAS domain-containing sensor histidine kinase [Crocinitomix catalasitica]